MFIDYLNAILLQFLLHAVDLILPTHIYMETVHASLKGIHANYSSVSDNNKTDSKYNPQNTKPPSVCNNRACIVTPSIVSLNLLV